LVFDEALIPAAGIGTRLLPVTKEMPKEMLPVFCRNRSTDGICLKPVLQVVFETLFRAGTRRFYMVVGRGKRPVEDHFTIDRGFLDMLSRTGRRTLASELSYFYNCIRKSTIVFVNQSEPRGFGDAVLCSRQFMESDPFLVHAGDDLVVSPGNGHIRRLNQSFTSMRASAAFFIEHTAHPERYGVIRGSKVRRQIYEVHEVVEKPKRPPSNFGVVAVYALSPIVFQYLTKVKPDHNGEIQLTDAIQAMVASGERVFAVNLRRDERRVDIGSPEGYKMALRTTFEQ
jgi:UTP--glucose-1-phosphate uridylyltransferase